MKLALQLLRSDLRRDLLCHHQLHSIWSSGEPACFYLEAGNLVDVVSDVACSTPPQNLPVEQHPHENKLTHDTHGLCAGNPATNTAPENAGLRRYKVFGLTTRVSFRNLSASVNFSQNFSQNFRHHPDCQEGVAAYWQRLRAFSTVSGRRPCGPLHNSRNDIAHHARDS